MVGLVFEHVVAVELLRGVAGAHPELRGAGAAFVGLGENRFARRCGCDNAYVCAGYGLKADADDASGRDREAVVEELAEEQLVAIPVPLGAEGLHVRGEPDHVGRRRPLR